MLVERETRERELTAATADQVRARPAAERVAPQMKSSWDQYGGTYPYHFGATGPEAGGLLRTPRSTDVVLLLLLLLLLLLRASSVRMSIHP